MATIQRRLFLGRETREEKSRSGLATRASQVLLDRLCSLLSPVSLRQRMPSSQGHASSPSRSERREASGEGYGARQSFRC